MNARRRRGKQRRPTGVWRVALVLAGVAALSTVAWETPPVRTVLLQSFTEQPASYTELYFTSSPIFDGSIAVVPVTVRAHGADAGPQRVHVELETAKGKVVDSSILTVAARDGVAVPVVAHLQIAGAVASVTVTLVGNTQRLHYTFGT